MLCGMGKGEHVKTARWGTWSLAAWVSFLALALILLTNRGT
jgi:hypothetical protein